MADFPCEAITDLCVDAYAAFIPAASAYMQGVNLDDISDPRFLRRVAHGHEDAHIDQFGDIRSAELQEAATVLAKLIDDSDGTLTEDVWDEDARGLVETEFVFKVPEDENQTWRWFEYLRFILIERKRDGMPAFSHVLRSGRAIGETELLATLALVQGERCVDAYLANDIESTVNFVAEVHRALDSIGAALHKQGISLRSRINGLIAHRRSPKRGAMEAVKEEFVKWQEGSASYANDSDFARRMLSLYPALINEGSIKNACSRWRAERKSSS